MKFPKTHFQSMDECAQFFTQWNFERELDEWAERVARKPISDFISI